jgi:hypothetical protein
MELFFFILEGALWIIDIVAASVDLYAWCKGKENRLERRTARKAGLEVPPRDRWTRRVIVLTLVVLVATAALLIWNW